MNDKSVSAGMQRDPAPAPSAAASTTGKPGEGIPVSSYRLQFNRDFTFRDAAALVPYLAGLGVTHCYASSYLKARPGSGHGYDIIDHNSLNPEIGTERDFEDYVAALKAHGMEQILDIVPNHMGVMGSENDWWLDVLENGASAAHAAYFDIDWNPVKKELRDKILLPVLGDHYGIVLHQGDLKLKFERPRGEFSVWYYQHRFPIDPGTYALILGHRYDVVKKALPEEDPLLLAYENIADASRNLPGHANRDPAERERRQRDKERIKAELAELCTGDGTIPRFIEENIGYFNGEPGKPETFELLHGLLEQQAYRLSFWKTASDEINYRRFFDINELAGLQVQHEAVFRDTHRLIFRYISEGKIAGVRVDHIDGLYDPAAYLRALGRGAGGRPLYVLVEKILAGHERLREDWPVHGTTGYEYANVVNGLFVDPAGEAALNHIYHRFIGQRQEFPEILYRSKRRIIMVEMSGELNVLAVQLNRISEFNPTTRDYTLNSLRNALTEVTACFPVYRTYVSGQPVEAVDRRYIDWAVAQAKKRSVTIETSVFDFLRNVLNLDIMADTSTVYREAIVDFVMHFQQYTSPVMAKGLEDTSLYRYHRLISVNEVGADPERFAVSVNAFHYLNQERLKHWPHGMLSTSTHDSKRSEDLRARVDVISEMPAEFSAHLARWRQINRIHKGYVNKRRAPDRNDEYLLYQTLLGSWPLEEPDAAGLDAYRNRIRDYMLKAIREAKLKTSWSYPDEEYEQALTAFIDALLASTHGPFLEDFVPLARRLARYGLYNSLALCLLKFTSPGMPDIYQGNELFTFNLTDPDNRHAVDYSRRAKLQDDIAGLDDLDADALKDRLAGMLGSMEDGRIKYYLTRQALRLRMQLREVFQSGDYLPLGLHGERADHACAFARARDGKVVIVVVPRLVHGLCPEDTAPPLGEVWGDTRVVLPEGLPVRYRDAFTRNELVTEDTGNGASLPLRRLLERFPAALLSGCLDVS